MGKNFCLCLEDTIPGFQIFQMALSDIGHNDHIRSCHDTQSIHLAKVGNSHLNDCNLMGWTDTKEGQR